MVLAWTRSGTAAGVTVTVRNSEIKYKPRVHLQLQRLSPQSPAKNTFKMGSGRSKLPGFGLPLNFLPSNNQETALDDGSGLFPNTLNNMHIAGGINL